MVDTMSSNGEAAVDLRYRLPETIELDSAEARRIPSPGTQRALKAETGKTWDELFGANADGADRTQTLIWMKLRREYPGLRWADCEDVAVQVEEGTTLPNPTSLAASASSQPSADSGD